MINYVIGDATLPQVNDPHGICYIAHCCNAVGGWGKGFVLALSNRWPEPEEVYRKLYKMRKDRHGLDLNLGTFTAVKVEEKIRVLNIIGQHGYRKTYEDDNQRYVDYDALRTAFAAIAKGIPESSSLHMPRIGCGLAGGEWSVIEEIVETAFSDRQDIDIYVYDLPDRLAA